MGAYALAAIPPAGVLATWRRDPKWFPKTLVPIALAGKFISFLNLKYFKKIFIDNFFVQLNVFLQV